MPPDRQWATFLRIPVFQPALAAPERKQRASDATAVSLVLRVMLAVDACGGAIFLADGVGMGGITQRLDIGGPDLSGKSIWSRAPAGDRIVDDYIRCSSQKAFRQRIGLGKQAPRPEGQRQPGISTIPGGGRGDDVENGDFRHGFGMVERQPVGDATATVVAGNHETVETENVHNLHHVARHRPFGIGGMIGSGHWTAALAVAPEIGGNHAEVRGQGQRYVAPHHMRFGKAMQEQQRRP
ncbi:hypothetical protein X750_03170 [Mesorhizobium sp. LNJC394B00]|nr:hypothetical protein X750_03170 [Mesorhizobium sp. LNJC394B00]